jgi:carbon starvation protein
MNSVVVLLAALGCFAIGYRYYGLFVARKVLRIDPSRPVPSVTMADEHDYVPMNKYVLFGHHFAAIAAAGPLLGPVLAAQYGWAPGMLWIILGTVLAGGVHDMTVLFMSVRHRGRSLGEIAGEYIGGTGGLTASISIALILVLTLAGFSIAVMNAMAQSPWATFTVFASIPIALLMGLHMKYFRPGDVKGASAMGCALLLLAVFGGHYVAASPWLAAVFTFSKHQLAVILAAYGFLASALPVWLMLCPRDYLTAWLKIGTITALALGIVFLSPTLKMPAVTEFVRGGGPVISGPLFPFLFITIACGAISGFHAIIASGTTPKMISSERDIPFVGYGAMMVESCVSTMALISACVLVPADYFAINSSPGAYAALGMTPVDLGRLSEEVRENLQGRTGGSVSLAVGMAYIFSSIPWMDKLMSYWYHYAVMFEALFVLSAVDAGTRIGRFMMEEMLGKIWPKFNDSTWWPGVILTGAAFSFFWGYLVYIGDISSIWPIFGMSNQLLAGFALIVVSVYLLASGRLKHIWVTLVPAAFLVVTTFRAGYFNLFKAYLPESKYLLAGLTVIVLALMAVVIVVSLLRCLKYIRVPAPAEEPLRQRGDL